MHQVVDENSTPTGVIEPYPGIAANEEFTLGPKEPDPDHCEYTPLGPHAQLIHPLIVVTL